MTRLYLGATLLLACLATTSVAPANAESDFAEAWRALRGLAGTWEASRAGREGTRLISYHLTSNGSVVFEEFVGDTPDGVHDMATAYHLDVDDLVATHYCGAGNQPRMRAASWNPETRVLRFDFWDVTHLPDPEAYYTTNIELRFETEDRVDLRFRGTTAGETGEWQTHSMRRLSRRATERADDTS